MQSALSRRSKIPTRQAYGELQVAYDHFNVWLFDQALPTCMITLQREKRTCGYFTADRFADKEGAIVDEIALNPTFFAVVPMVETMQTLVHEMCHLWQRHFGKPGRGRYHNEEWASKMESIGLMPSDTGRPGGRRTGDQMADYAIVGGRFLEATQRLLTNDFMISWYDRFPEASLVQMGASGMSTQLDPSVGGGAPPIKAVESLARVIRPVSAEASGAALNKSNRTKYVCQCPTQVWGKPGLDLHCGRCQSRFEAQR